MVIVGKNVLILRLVAYMHRLFNEKKQCFTHKQNFLIDAVDQIYKTEICF